MQIQNEYFDVDGVFHIIRWQISDDIDFVVAKTHLRIPVPLTTELAKLLRHR